MSIVILRIAAALYALAAGAYIVFFSRPRHRRAATVGFWVLAAAFVVHAAAIGVGCSEYGGAEFFGLRASSMLLVWLLTGAYLFLQRYYKLPTIGAFVTPLALVVLLPRSSGRRIARVSRRRRCAAARHAAHPLRDRRRALRDRVRRRDHVLLQEREVKGKHFGALFSRLPSLDALDQMIQRLVRAGFVVYTIALVAGTVTATTVWNSAWSCRPAAGGLARHLDAVRRDGPAPPQRLARAAVRAHDDGQVRHPPLVDGVLEDLAGRHAACRRLRPARDGGLAVSGREVYLVGLSHRARRSRCASAWR